MILYLLDINIYMISFKLNLPLGSDAKNDQPKKSQGESDYKWKTINLKI